MAHAVAVTVYHDNKALLREATALAVGNAEIRHRYRLTDDAPSGDWKLAIPGFVHYAWRPAAEGAERLILLRTFTYMRGDCTSPPKPRTTERK